MRVPRDILRSITNLHAETHWSLVVGKEGRRVEPDGEMGLDLGYVIKVLAY